MKNLIYGLTSAYYSGERRHTQDVMNELGIKYQLAISQTMGDVIQFYCCENIPKELPSFLKEFKRDNDFQGSVGYGLSQEDADMLDKFVKDKEQIMISKDEKTGVMVVKNGKGWGLCYADGHSTSYGWISMNDAEIHNPKYCKKTTDVTYANSHYIDELKSAELVTVKRITTTEIVR